MDKPKKEKEHEKTKKKEREEHVKGRRKCEWATTKGKCGERKKKRGKVEGADGEDEARNVKTS